VGVLHTSLALLALAPLAGAQIMNGPEPPRVEWEQRLGNTLPLATPLVDHEGQATTLGACFGERPVLLALVYYECPMLCDLVFEGLLTSLRALEFQPGTDFDLVAVSIDPAEGPELAAGKRASVLEDYGIAPGDARARGLHFLTGQEADVHAIADAVGFVYTYVPETDEWAHPAGITLATRGGEVSRVLFGVEFAARDLRFALIEASEGRIGSPLDQALLRCFHYDPLRGKYGFAVMTTVRTLGVVTLLVLGSFVWLWLRRERRARPQPAGTRS
jgi:protein SCO1/2